MNASMNASKDNDVMIKRLTGKWDVWRNENKANPWPTDRWVQGLSKKKKEKKKKERKKKEKRKKKKEKLHQSTFLDADLFYFPLVDVISGSLH